jgi:predicted nucleic acid-binding protein
MKFWDSSAITPLLVPEADSSHREQQLSADSEMLVWFGTLAEVESSLARRKRSSQLPPEAELRARRHFDELSAHWTEVTPTNEVRARAIRLLRVHTLRAADAFQLAAALVFCREQPQHLPILTADQRLRSAAQLEGFPIE